MKALFKKYLPVIVFFLSIIYFYVDNEHAYALVLMLFTFSVVGIIFKLSSKFFFLFSILMLGLVPILIQANQIFVFDNVTAPEKIAKLVYIFIILGLVRELSENIGQ